MDYEAFFFLVVFEGRPGSNEPSLEGKSQKAVLHEKSGVPQL
jgi:hypothetical protein